MKFLLISVVVLALFWIVFILTLKSIEKLGYRIGSFYPFDREVKKGNQWSTIFYIVLTLLITVFTYLVSQGTFSVSPA